MAKSEKSTCIEIEAITVRTGRLVCTIRIADPRFRETTPALVNEVKKRFPDIGYHCCANDSGNTFADTMESTSLAHMLEHICIALQVESAEKDTDEFIGITEWLDYDQGRAQIQLGFHDDLVALTAFNEAVIFLNDAVIICTYE